MGDRLERIQFQLTVLCPVHGSQTKAGSPVVMADENSRLGHPTGQVTSQAPPSTLTDVTHHHHHQASPFSKQWLGARYLHGPFSSLGLLQKTQVLIPGPERGPGCGVSNWSDAAAPGSTALMHFSHRLTAIPQGRDCHYFTDKETEDHRGRRQWARLKCDPRSA